VWGMLHSIRTDAFINTVYLNLNTIACFTCMIKYLNCTLFLIEGAVEGAVVGEVAVAEEDRQVSPSVLLSRKHPVTASSS